MSKSLCRCASLDGDADRLVYFQRRGAADEVHLFDGDRIAVLAALLVMDLLRSLPTAEQPPPTVRTGASLLLAPLHGSNTPLWLCQARRQPNEIISEQSAEEQT